MTSLRPPKTTKCRPSKTMKDHVNANPPTNYKEQLQTIKRWLPKTIKHLSPPQTTKYHRPSQTTKNNQKLLNADYQKPPKSPDHQERLSTDQGKPAKTTDRKKPQKRQTKHRHGKLKRRPHKATQNLKSLKTKMRSTAPYRTQRKLQGR